MAGKMNPKRKKAQQGERMIEVKVRFWTDNIEKGKGFIRPKHAWARGVIRMERNDSHGIEPQDPLHFNSLMELLSVIEKVLINHGIVLHPVPKMKKYFDLEQ